MSEAGRPPEFRTDSTQRQVRLLGDWCLQNAMEIADQLRAVPDATRRIDARGIERIDSAGAMLILRHARQHGIAPQDLDFRDDHQPLLALLGELSRERPPPPRDFGFNAALERLGRRTHEYAQDIVQLIGFGGENLAKFARLLREPQRIRLKSLVANMEHVGLDAAPLVAVLSYLIGGVIVFVGSTILRSFGAEIYVVDMGSSILLREFSGLMTAVVVAGRSASAFTAQIGAMKSNEEVDALRTLGLDPIDVLVLPRIVALVLMLPLLTFLAMMAGLAGGITVCALDLGIRPAMYLSRMHEYTAVANHFWVGMAKTPLFALVIALVGCLEGLKVSGTAQSVGERTTSSVVQSISLVIVLDALAALWFMHMGW